MWGPEGQAQCAWGPNGPIRAGMQWLGVVGCPTGGPGLALGAQPPSCSQIQWAPQLVAPNGLHEGPEWLQPALQAVHHCVHNGAETMLNPVMSVNHGISRRV